MADSLRTVSTVDSQSRQPSANAGDPGYTPIADIMQTVVHTAAPEWPLTSLERFLIDNHIGGVPVLDEGRLVGIVSRSDVVRQLCVERTEAERMSDYYRDQSGFDDGEARLTSWQDIAASVGLRIDSLTVADVMIGQVLSVSPATRVRAAARLMTAHGIHRLPVLDGERLVGMVTTLDMARLLAGESTADAPETTPSAQRKESEDGVLRAREIIEQLARDLHDPEDTYDQEIFETHISIVLLTGERAIKIKKPLDLGFLDFSTLEARRHFCQRELEFNRRYAPSLYLRVVAITGSPAEPSFNGDGVTIEYAVEMRRFPNEARLDVEVEAATVTDDDFVELGRRIADLHGRAAVGDANETYGDPLLIEQQICNPLKVLSGVAKVADIERSTLDLLHRCAPIIERRRAEHHIRDCHGDLHLTNLVRVAGRFVPFDCIEFDDSLRYIDTASDIAFLLMDLDVRQRGDLANTLLNSYLSVSGDYGSLPVLRLYCVYRSIVRAMVSHLQVPDAQPAGSARDKRDQHLALAQDYLETSIKPGLIITHGLSGSGKSYWSRKIATRAGFIHIRSDVERRRLVGLSETAASGSPLGAGIYDRASSANTYERLLGLARQILSCGYSVIVDATFLERAWRDKFSALAAELAVPFHILSFEAPQSILEQRIEARAEDGNDVSEATLEVLRYQLEKREPIASEEQSVPAADVVETLDAGGFRSPDWGAGRLAR